MPDIRRILIIEDDTLVASCLCDVLRDLGFSIIGPASSGAEALSLAELHNPDLAIIDIRLSGKMDGIQVAKAFEERFGIAVIFLSGLCDDKMMSRAQAVHPVRILHKPFRASALLNAIETAANVQTAAKTGAPTQIERRGTRPAGDAGRILDFARRHGDKDRQYGVSELLPG